MRVRDVMKMSLALFVIASGCSGGGSGSGSPKTPTVSATVAPDSTPSPSPSPTGRPGATASPSHSPTPAATSTPTSGPSAAATKSPIHGLVTMGLTSFNDNGGNPDNGMEEINAHPSVYRAAVINVTWSQLEPAQGVFDNSAIESALATIATYNSMYPSTPVVAKLRVWAGPHVAPWVMQVAGGPIAIAGSRPTLEIAAFWTPAYKSAWQGLQAHIAASYDADPRIAETTVNSCASRTDEPFIASLDATSLANMRRYGFSDAAYQGCLANAAADYRAWRLTPIDFTFNPYRDSDGPKLVQDPGFTISVMQAWRSALGARAVIANHGLQPAITPAAQPIYDEFTTLGRPIELQGYAPTIDWNASIATALSYDPTEIEIWQTVAAGGNASISESQLQMWAGELP